MLAKPRRRRTLTRITHLFFDAGNTLVFVNMGVVSHALAQREVFLPPEELWRGEHRARRLVDHPQIVARSTDAARWELYFRTILRECGVDREDLVRSVLEDLRRYHEERNLWEVVPPEVPLVLERLRKRYRLAVVSNSNGTVRSKLWRVGLAPYFDVIVDSQEERVEKPDPRIFWIAMERAGARPGRSLHVGDFYHIDVVGARAAGMEAVLLDPGDVHGDKPVRRIDSIQRLV